MLNKVSCILYLACYFFSDGHKELGLTDHAFIKYTPPKAPKEVTWNLKKLETFSYYLYKLDIRLIFDISLSYFVFLFPS